MANPIELIGVFQPKPEAFERVCLSSALYLVTLAAFSTVPGDVR